MAAHPFRENVTCGKGSKKKRSQPSIIWPRTHFETLANRNKDGKEKWIKDSKGRNEIKRGNENDFNLIFIPCVYTFTVAFGRKIIRARGIVSCVEKL